MASVNRKVKEEIETYGGGHAIPISPKQQLERSVMSCLLWEDEFYEDGKSIVARICDLVKQNTPQDVADIAIRAKQDMRLRHVPLLLARELARTKEGRKQLVHVLPKVITRADDIPELLAIYFQQKIKPRESAKLPNQLKKHLGNSFKSFDEYQLGKYSGGSKSVSLKDAMKLTHPVADNAEQSALWKKLLLGKLKTPDTWEVDISATKDVKASWTRLLTEGKFGGLALLRNIRNMVEANVDENLIQAGIKAIKAARLLPINFIAAAKYNPRFEPAIEEKLLECLAERPQRLLGKTIIIIDTSGSMGGKLSEKSKLERRDVAAGLVIIAREICADPIIYCTAGNDVARMHATMQIPARRGFALSDYITGSEVGSKIGGGGIFLVQCLDFIKAEQKKADRIILITDEQDCDSSSKSPERADVFGTHNYLINIASAKNGVGYRNKWTHIDGWSDKVMDYIINYETARN